MRDGSYYPTLILEYNAGPLGTAASLHAALAIPNVTLLEASWVNRETETDVVWPYPEVVEDYALPLQVPGLGTRPTKRWSTRRWRCPSRLCPRCSRG